MLEGDGGTDRRRRIEETKPERISVMTLADGGGARRRRKRVISEGAAAPSPPLVFVFMSSLPKSDETKCESGRQTSGGRTDAVAAAAAARR